MKQPNVDVIIPTYNGLPYLKEAVESVLAQTHRELTLYVVDDGSTDNGATAQYVKSLKDPKVKYLHKANGGQATARNLGVTSSHSAYITFLDSDDLMRPDKIARQLELMNKNPAVGMVYGWCRLVDAHNNAFGSGKVVWRKRGRVFKSLLQRQKIPGSASMVMIKREVFDKVGLFHEDFLIGEDWEMWLRIARNYPVDYVPDFIVDLRVLGNSMQRNYLKMVKGLDYMLPVIIAEFNLRPLERARLKAGIYREMALQYMNAHETHQARRALWRAIGYWPPALLVNYQAIWLSYIRILFGNALLRSIRRKLSPAYRAREKENVSK